MHNGLSVVVHSTAPQSPSLATRVLDHVALPPTLRTFTRSRSALDNRRHGRGWHHKQREESWARRNVGVYGEVYGMPVLAAVAHRSDAIGRVSVMPDAVPAAGRLTVPPVVDECD